MMQAGGSAMKVVILAGGYGTRLAEETELRPKPMVEIGGKPLLWHIMKHYARFGHREFIVALGYKGEMIKEYFARYCNLNTDVTIDLSTGQIKAHQSTSDNWIVHLIDTGLNTNTGGRIRRLAPLLSDSAFMLTYGDGVSDLDIEALMQFHRKMGRIATLTAVRPPARFGGVIFDGDLVADFTEKPQIGEGWINGGFMVLEPAILQYLSGDDSSLEGDGLENLAKEKQLAAYRHGGFWQCMDTLRDKRLLEALWNKPQPPWKVWSS